jgi:hypothetical protein
MLSGKGGVTHNMLDDIHNHWKRAEAVRIKCLGVPTLDMDNICFHLEVIVWYYMLENLRFVLFSLCLLDMSSCECTLCRIKQVAKSYTAT